jgi:chemotaxis protein methyltransferase CheR
MARSASVTRELPNPLDHELLRELAITRFGLDLPPRRRAAVATRLVPRLGDRGMGSFGEYYRLLRDLPASAEEWGRFADVVTNSETYFFRGPEQFADLVALLPELARSGRRLRVLSAGCATGEEAYSLAAVLADHAVHLPQGFDVVGVDISTPRLAQACAGRYSARSARLERTPGGTTLEAHFLRDGDGWTPRPELRARVNFQLGNLAAPDGLGLGRFDVIFCRNVLIYAHDSGWPRFLRTLAGALAPGGHLFLGESETLLGRSSPFQPRRLRRHYAYVLAPCRSA